jgi:proteasome lid subunit RPN8/RPN11
MKPGCSQEVLDQVIEHVNSSTSAEVGGVLVGTITAGTAKVTASIPAHKATSESANVTFTHEVWEEVLPIVDSDHPGESIIGWYHSHPGFGIFLSEYDRFIQKNFFGEPGMLALVIDPLAGEGGWFGWEEGEITEPEKFETPLVESTAAVQAKEERVGRTRRSNLLLAVSITAVIGFVAGYLLHPSNSSTSNSQTSEVSTLQTENVSLQQQLNNSIQPSQLEDCTFSYTVKEGDNLWWLSQRFFGDGRSFGNLTGSNGVPLETTSIEVGQVLLVPVHGCAPSSSSGGKK